MNRSSIVFVCCSIAWFLLPVPEARTQERNQSKAVEDWIRKSAVPFDDSTDDFGAMDGLFRRARVIALGEATHGQHEVFEIKRQLTMHLIRTQGIRLVAYEASASKMLDANEYVSCNSNDRERAMAGFGMLIWQIEENRALLDDLREWNRQASEQDRVRLIGIDAQDREAAKSRLIQLIGEGQVEAVLRINDLAPRAQKSIAEMMAGNLASWDEIVQEIEDLRALLQKQVPSDSAKANEYLLRVQEFLYSLTIFSSRGGRDQAMAELLLNQLEQTGAESRCVVWAHNAHVQLSPLGYLGSTDLAMGGHLAKRLGDRFYALGVAFGEGEFQANAPATDGGWGFRRYRLSPAPEGSLESMLGKIGLERFLVDLRGAPESLAVQQWLRSPHGQRWYGGYSVPDDCDALTRDASKLMPTTPREDFDGLLYVAKTKSAKPLNSKLILDHK
jgi:erythromycin esterase